MIYYWEWFMVREGEEKVRYSDNIKVISGGGSMV